MLPGLVAPAMFGKASRHGTAIAAGQKVPLLQSEMRQLVKSDEKIFRALILIDVIFRARNGRIAWCFRYSR